MVKQRLDYFSAETQRFCATLPDSDCSGSGFRGQSGNSGTKMGHFSAKRCCSGAPFILFGEFCCFWGPWRPCPSSFGRKSPFYRLTSEAVATRLGAFTHTRMSALQGRIVGSRGRGNPGPQRRGRGAEDVPGPSVPALESGAEAPASTWRGRGPESNL